MWKVFGTGVCSKGKLKIKGFSLIELMIVIGIIAVLSVAILPSVIGAKEKAMQARYLADCKTIISAVEVYNATSSSDNIADGTTITQLKGKLFDNMNINDRYIRNWPKKLPNNLEGTDKTYRNLLDYVNNFEMQSNGIGSNN